MTNSNSAIPAPVQLQATAGQHVQDWALVRLNGNHNLTQRQREMFAHLVIKTLGATNMPGQTMFGWCTSGDLTQDCAELAQVLFRPTV